MNRSVDVSVATEKTFAFSTTLDGVSELTTALADALFEAGCGDATPASRDGVVTIYFDREAGSLGDAIGSAVKDVERAGFAVARVDVDGPQDTRGPVSRPAGARP